MKIKNVLSVFDGCSCGQEALVRSGISYEKYYSSEINEQSIKITMKNYPKTIQLGDVKEIDYSKLDKINLLMGGSPCTNLSIAGKRNGLLTKDNLLIKSYYDYVDLKSKKYEFEGQSYLFWEFIRAHNELNPDYFLLENVRMKKEWEKVFTDNLKVEPILINSSLLSAQNRERLYWTNIPNIKKPKDKNIKFSDIIPGVKGAGKRGVGYKGNYNKVLTIRKDNKSNCLVTQPYMTNCYVTPNGDYKMITPEEAELLQTMRVGYTSGVPKTYRYEMIGNGWTIDVISYILNHINDL